MTSFDLSHVPCLLLIITNTIVINAMANDRVKNDGN